MPAVAAVYRAAHPGRRRTVARWTRTIERTEALSPDELDERALDRVRAQVRHAMAHVPFYRRAYADLGITADDLRSTSDVARLPMLEKRHLQEHLEDLVAEGVDARSRYYFSTGGSTGIPVGFYHDIDQPYREEAFIRWMWRRVGYRTGDTSVVIRGGVVPGGRLWRRDPIRSSLVVSSYHLTDANLPRIVERIRRFRPRFVQAYPSAATIVARFMLESGLPPFGGLAAVLCGSENLYPWQRSLITEAFGSRVFSWYGQSEAVALAAECEHDERLHVFGQYGLVELVDDEGSPVTEVGRAGEIVATGLDAVAMPLIRYRTTDVAVLGPARCEACGRPYRLLERIEGRLQEFMVGGSGRMISMTAINMHSAVFDEVRLFRFAQRLPGEVTLRVVPRQGFSLEVDGRRIREELAPKLGDDVRLSLEVVDEIPRSASGKFHFIDQELPSPFGRNP